MVRDEIQIAAERDYAVRTGREEGRAEANLETARKLKQAGADIELISQCTGLSAEEVEAL